MSKITLHAKDMPCIRCGMEGETRACHYSGPRQLAFGKGRGIKCADVATAEFCHRCDQDFTEGSVSEAWKDKWERSEDFMYWIIMTAIRREKD